MNLKMNNKINLKIVKKELTDIIFELNVKENKNYEKR